MAAKTLSELYWVEDLLEQTSYVRKPMFGGFGFYLKDRMILALFEGDGESTYKGKDYHFEIWHGCLFPIEREYHPQALQQFPFLVPHPVLSKWLYLPLKTENFEDLTSKIIRQILKPDSYWGVIPKAKRTTTKKILKSTPLQSSEKVNMKVPQMFRDEPLSTEKAATFKKISDFKNLGPESEKHFKAAGIKTPNQFIQLGWQKTWLKLASHNKKHAHTLYGYALIAALQNKDWGALTETEKQQAKDFAKQIKTKLAKKK